MSARAADREWVKLNVGGQLIRTTMGTLARGGDSFLTKLCQNDPDYANCKDEDGAYLIDRDPVHFRPVLNFLRHGKLVVDAGVSLEGVLEEAEFYGVMELIPLVKARLEKEQLAAAAGSSAGHDGTSKAVAYRVFASNEEELTTLMSNLSDGWRFEQLVNVESYFPFDGKHKGSQLLVVVSRSVDAADSSACGSRAGSTSDLWPLKKRSFSNGSNPTGTTEEQ